MDARLREGIRLFNEGRYFEAHESIEDFYVRADERHKPFLEALVQLAAACRVYREFDEVKGPVRMVHQAIIRLENYQPVYLRVKVKNLIREMESWAKRAEGGSESRAGDIPKIGVRRFILF
jgi:uncharacterized protein